MNSQVRRLAEVDPTDALENGDVLLVTEALFESREAERRLFSPAILSGGKNVSFDPATGHLGGTVLDGADRGVLADMMARFSHGTAALVRQVFPAYAARVQLARTSFRPVEIAGRPSSWRKDDTRLHIDSFPASPVHGWRILRVFTNVNPAGRPRSWRLGEDFESVCRRFAPRLRLPLPGTAAVLRALRVTKSRRTPYDALMLQLHDRMKADDAYQSGTPQLSIDFLPGATWIAFTDQVSHAALAGQYQLEQTFLLPVDAMRAEHRSPLRILERLKGRPLV